jgi:hypothetical protein
MDTGAGIMFEWLFRKKNKKKAKDQTGKLTKDNKGAPMNNDYEFVIKVDKVYNEYLAKIDGPNGIFYLMNKGTYMGQSELGDWYFYGDQHSQFFFISNYDADKNAFNIKGRSTEYGGGAPVHLNHEQRAIVEQNIFYGFTTRVPFTLNFVEAKSDYKAGYDVIFSWDS